MNRFVIKSDFSEYMKIFLGENSKINLISKNEEKYLYEKHIYDSLAIKLFFDIYGLPQKLLDIGTGGGFPAIPLAIEYPQINVVALDSRGKKIASVNNIAQKLGLKNIKCINDRVENYTDSSFDVIVSRAVGKVDKLIEYSYPILKKGGFLVLYKSKEYNNELDAAKDIIRKNHLKILPVIEYDLPLEENYKRVLVVFKK